MSRTGASGSGALSGGVDPTAGKAPPVRPSDALPDTFLLAPPLRRGAMVPTPWGNLNPVRRWLQSIGGRRRHQSGCAPGAAHQHGAIDTPPSEPMDIVDAPDPLGSWQRQGNLRRLTLLVLMLVQTAYGTYTMAKVLPYQGTAPIEMLLLAMFAVLFCWISAGFWTALAGFLVLLRGHDAWSISRDLAQAPPLPSDARTAIVMPICNEDVTRVIAGLRATYASIQASAGDGHFDFFLLSDSNQSDVRAAELAAWERLCREVGGFGHIFYRHRKRRVKRKSGNLDDFCRRWGQLYRYMIVLDADSVMSGDCVISLVRLMEGNPGAGIIQTSPVAAGSDSLYARIQQFSSRVYGPLFTAGLHYWQLGESHYWGHNAIIRIAPFMRHCALSALPGRGSLAGEILSHDFVEAALMRRAGWAVWIAYDLQGSYEEMPSSLLEELKRDRRWCHGNLMNFRLFMARGMHRVHRAVFATGVMAYLSAPLWLAFLIVSTVLLAVQSLTDPTYFVQPRQLFPIWPQWHPEQALALFSATATLLFLPKILGILLVIGRGARSFGGLLHVVLSMLGEMLFSMLLAPVRMMFHTRFVVAAFLGLALHWKSPPRGDAETHINEALGKHGGDMLLGLVWAGSVYVLNPAFLPWLLPIVGGLMLSAPLSILSSSGALGRWCRAARLFVIPEEIDPPVELAETARLTAATAVLPGFVETVVDAGMNRLVQAAGRHGAHPRPLDALTQAFASTGPVGLSEAQKNALLDDAVRMAHLHHQVTATPATLARWQPQDAGIAGNAGIAGSTGTAPDR